MNINCIEHSSVSKSLFACAYRNVDLQELHVSVHVLVFKSCVCACRFSVQQNLINSEMEIISAWSAQETREMERKGAQEKEERERGGVIGV